MSCAPTSLPNARASYRGFTLIEVLVVMALLGVLAAFAVPSLQLYLERSRLRSYSNELVASLQYAKSEALARNGNVRFCPNLGDATSADCNSVYKKAISGTTACPTPPYFNDGWKITTDTEVIRTIRQPSPNGLGVCLTGNTAATKTIELDSLGRPSQQLVVITITGSTLCRLIVVHQTGLIEMRTEDQTELGQDNNCRITSAI